MNLDKWRISWNYVYSPFNKTNLASNESDWKHRNLPGSTDLLKEPNIVGVVVVGEVDDPLVEVTENPAESCSAARHSTRVELTFLISDDILFLNLKTFFVYDIDKFFSII